MSSALELADELLSLHIHLKRHFDAAMAVDGVTLAKHRLLAMLRDHGPCRSIDIATHFTFAPRSVTEAVDALEREGLAVRVADPHDRRAKLVSITEAGTAALRASSARREEAVETIFGSLDAEQRDQLHTLLGALRRKLLSTP